MASVYPYAGPDGKRLYRAVWRGPDNKQTSKRGFATKKAAEEHVARMTVTKADGQYIRPGDARVSVRDLGTVWLDGRSAMLKPSSYRPLESAWRIHVEPTWGAKAVGAIRFGDVETWVSGLSRTHGATTVHRALGVLAAILDRAEKDRRIPANPARGVDLPRKVGKARAYLTHAQVDLLARESKRPELVRFLAYTGLRWGEATGLRVRHVDALRRRVTVEENAVMVGSRIEVGTPKTHERRSVPYPAFLELAVARLCEGKGRDGLVFGNGSKHLPLPNSRDGWFAAAVRRAMTADPDFPRVTIHGLRHTAASLAISAGANVKAVQRMLGHASAAMTLDTYADLFDDDLDGVAVALDQARTSAIVVRDVATGST